MTSTPHSTPTHSEQKHPPIRYGKTGVLLVNLGTPDSTGWWDIRRYLKEFLSDQRVVEVNRWLWKIILNVIILTFRPAKSARAYRKIWREETNESPLRYYTRQQAEKLAKKHSATESLIIDWAMRYGAPSIKSRLQVLSNQGCTRLLVMPLYPQYSASTSASVCDETFRALMKMRWQPTLRIAEPYYDHPAYIDALAQSVTSHLATLDWEPDVILASFHGIPQEYHDKGDPYFCHCHKTARLLREKLGMSADKLRLSFQSRFGPREWLQPYTSTMLETLPAEGANKVALIAPGFVSDCVETLEELIIEGQQSFTQSGGTHFTFVPCLNESDSHITMLSTLMTKDTAGWKYNPTH